jgi:uncharacterized protein (TIGR02118 family)
MVKLLFALRRKPEMPPADFRHYFKDVHTRYSTKPPFQQNYWQCHVVDSAYAASAPPYDGVSQIWFADMSGLAGYFASPELGVGMEDGQRFLDLNNFFSFVGREHRII